MSEEQEVPELFNQVVNYLEQVSKAVHVAKLDDRWDDYTEKGRLFTAVAALMQARTDKSITQYLEMILDEDWRREAPKETVEYMLTNLVKWQNTIRAAFGITLLTQEDVDPFLRFISLMNTIKST